MKSGDGSSCSFTKSWTPAPDPAGSQHCEDERTDTEGGTSSSVGPVSFVDEQDAGFKMSPLKEEPEEEDYLHAEPSSSIGHIIQNAKFLKNPKKEEDPDDTEYLNNPVKEEESEDKDYLYCEDCRSFFINKCEVHGPAVFIPDTPVPLGVTDRARQTLPPGLEIQVSSIPHAGLGVFNEGETVPVGAHFGPYQGELVDREEAMKSGYSWVISKNGTCEEYIDAKSEVHANWMRYVNCARTDEEQNLVVFQYRGEILYRCCRPINPGQELLVWYEEEYAKDLSVVFDYIWNKKCSPNDVNNSLLNVFSCSLCPLSYTSEKSLHRHVRRCHNEQHVKMTGLISLSNPTPTESYSDQQTLSGTLLTSTSEKETQKEVHKCLDCGKSFPRQSALQRHQHIHTGEKLYRCSQCGKSFTKKRTLQTHKRIHTGEKPYQCSQCGKGFAHRGYFKVHERIHTGEKPFCCSQCGLSFTEKTNLRTHQRIHTGEKPYLCSECGKVFTYHSSFQRHQRIHKGEKPYHCSQCGKSFTEKRNLQIHQRVHTGEKPYQCSKCGKGFTHQSNVKVHQRIHIGEKPYYCSQCGKRFTDKYNLQIHQFAHTGEKLYQCSQCPEGFTNKRKLQTHQRTHTEQKTFLCSQCGKSFTEKGNLLTHQQTHSKEKLYQCSHCGESLTSQSDVELHQRVHQWRLAKAGR